MAEKRYYWLKLTEQFFKDKPMKKLRKIAGGDTYTIIYLKMLLRAITQGNRLYFEGVEENFIDELALDLDEEPDNVSVTISYLKSKGLLKVVGTDEMELLQCEEMIGTETDAARRKRLQRERERQRELQGVAQQAIPEENAHPQLPTDEKPKKETQAQIFRRLSDNYSLSDPLKEQLEVWFKYKTERKEPYKEQGMKSLLKQIEKRAEKYGDKAIIDLIETCMSSNWKGIIWDILEKNNVRKSGIQSRVSEVDNW
ncbi:MAG: phage replisome organizer N-terminal domain-containing protein [Eubacteriales bacterium]|nr:phage replisome organizer N-terminal domain-containing protein [Eubacteriales bacterium]